jgi:hypothetical protein
MLKFSGCSCLSSGRENGEASRQAMLRSCSEDRWQEPKVPTTKVLYSGEAAYPVAARQTGPSDDL